MSDLAVMPLADYQDACNAVREKTGGTEAIMSGELAEQIRGIQSDGSGGGAAVPGAKWIKASIGTAANPEKLFCVDGVIFCSVSSGGTIYRSEDGKTWTGVELPQHSGNVYKMVADEFTQNVFFAITRSGIYRSTDRGIAWTRVFTTGVYDIAFGYTVTLSSITKKYVAATGTGIATSTNGTSWTASTVASAIGICFANGIWVAVDGGVIKYSKNTTTWTTVSGRTGAYQLVGYHNGVFVAVPDSGAICYSVDGSAWTETTAVLSSVRNVDYAEGCWFVTDNTGLVLVSEDGKTWEAQTWSGQTPRCVRYGGVWMIPENTSHRLLAASSADEVGHTMVPVFRDEYAGNYDIFYDIIYAKGLWLLAKYDGLYYSETWADPSYWESVSQ